jgi:hypothetical protein
MCSVTVGSTSSSKRGAPRGFTQAQKHRKKVCTAHEFYDMVVKARRSLHPRDRLNWVQKELCAVRFEHPQFGEACVNWTTLAGLSHSQLGFFTYSQVSKTSLYTLFGTTDAQHGDCSVCCKNSTSLITSGARTYTICPFCCEEEHCVDNFAYFANHMPAAKATARFTKGKGLGVFGITVRRDNMYGNRELFINYGNGAIKGAGVQTTTTRKWCCAHLPAPKIFSKKTPYRHLCMACYRRLLRKKGGKDSCPACLANPPNTADTGLVCDACRRRWDKVAK